MESVLSSPSTSRKKPLGFFWRMRMAFSVVSTMDGSMFGSLSISKRRSPGSNRAGVGEKKTGFHVKIHYVCLISPQRRCSRKESPIFLHLQLLFQYTGSDTPQRKDTIQSLYSSKCTKSRKRKMTDTSHHKEG